MPNTRDLQSLFALAEYGINRIIDIYKQPQVDQLMLMQ